MKARLYKRKEIVNNSKKNIIVIILILLNTVFLLYSFNKNVTPKLLNIAEASINKLNEDVILNYKVSDSFKKIDLNNIIIIEKNINEEIINVDFNLENVYESLSLIVNYVQNELNNLETRKNILKYYDGDISSSLDEIILNIPIGVASDFIYFASLGPKIPVRVSYMDYLASKIRLEVKNYGINNSLISIYVDTTITNEFLVPNKDKKINHTYSILIASKIIEGIVPKYYGGVINESRDVNIPLN